MFPGLRTLSRLEPRSFRRHLLQLPVTKPVHIARGFSRGQEEPGACQDRSFLPWCPEAERSSPLGLDLTSRAKQLNLKTGFPSPHGLEGWGLQQERLGWRWPPFTVFVQTFGFESITHLKGFMRHKGPPSFPDSNLLPQG